MVKRGAGWGRLAAALAAAVLLSSCQQARDCLARIDHAAFRAYHASRWQAVLTACVDGAQPYTTPLEPASPRRCADLEPQYAALAQAWRAAQAGLAGLAAEGAVEEQYLGELVGVLANRDRARITGLAGQLALYEQRLDQAQASWQAGSEVINTRLAGLQASWETVWPLAAGRDLDFALAGGVAALRQSWPALASARQRELAEYHRQHYARLAMIYLNYEPDFMPLPAAQAPVPPGSARLAVALARLEGGLLVRFDLDEAIEADLARLAGLAGFTPGGGQGWDRLELPAQGWPHLRAEAALARLQVLKRADALLTRCLDCQQAAVSQAWLDLWPGCPLELNIFAFAGLARTASRPEPLADWQEFTFRK